MRLGTFASIDSTAGAWTREAAVAKAFETAQCLCPDRAWALTATRRASAILDVAVTLQDKRLYYRPRRADRLEPARTKVFLCEAHLLQRLVAAEAETAPVQTQSDFTVAFLTASVRRALERNSFHAALCVSRVIRDHSTREGMLLYERLVGDRQRVRSQQYWRARKQQLMSELKRLFGDRLEVRCGTRGEERFAVVEDPGPLLPVVGRTLAALTPWGTPCVAPPLAWTGDAAEDTREALRMHALLHLPCFERLAGSAGLESPAARLAIPRWQSSRRGDDGTRRQPPSALRAPEQEALGRELAELSRRRRQAPGTQLRVLVDGVERGRLEPDRDATCRIALGADATRLEVVTQDLPGADPLLLAWLPLEREAETDGYRPLRRRIRLEGGQRLTFVVVPAAAGEEEAAEALVHYQETAVSRLLALRVRRAGMWLGRSAWRPVLAPAAALVAVLGLTLTLFRTQAPQPSVAPSVAPPFSLSPAPLPPGKAASQASTSPPVLRSGGAASRQVSPDLSVPGPTRSLKSDQATVALAEVRVIWLVLPKGLPADSALARAIGEQIPGSGLVVGQSPDDADAALEIEILEPTAATAPGDLHWSARLVNARGVLWPVGGAPRSYHGPLGPSVARMVRELTAAASAARRTKAGPT